MKGLYPVAAPPLHSSSTQLNAPKVFAIKPTGDFVYVVNYGSDSITRHIIDPNTGLINTPIFADQFGTDVQPQAIVIHPTLNYLYVANDTPQTIQSYSINAVTGGLTVNGSTLSTGGGPSCLVIDPTGNFIYCVSSWVPSKISGYRINQADGTLSILPGSPYATTNSTGVIVLENICIDPAGKYLYAPMNGVGYVEGYSIDSSTGVLTHLLPLSGWSYPHTAAANPVVVKIKQ